MGRERRVELIKGIEKERDGRLLLTYVTSTRPGFSISMADDCIRLIYEHLSKTKPEQRKKGIDLFLYSHGGSGVLPWRLVNLIREFTSSFEVLVPYKAYSAATLTALGADRILMHPMGELGPIDPSVSNRFNPDDPFSPGNKIPIDVEDVSSYISLIKDDVGITHQDELIKAIEILAQKIHPLALGNVKRHHSQSELTARKLLRLHMPAGEESKIQSIVTNLKSKLFFHGHPINRKEAREDLNLKVENPNQKLEKLMWGLYQEYENELSLRTGFNPIEIMTNAEKPIEDSILKLTKELNDLDQEKEESKKKINELKRQIQKSEMDLQMLQVPIDQLKGAYVESRELCHVFNVSGRIKKLPTPQNLPSISPPIVFDVFKQCWELEER